MGLSKMVGGMESAHVTRDEVAVYAKMGASAGELQPQESKVIANVLRLGNIEVEDIMTPRSVMFTLDRNTTVGDVTHQYEELPFARLPVYDGDKDHPVGFVLRKDILEAVGEDRHDTPLAELVQPLPEIRETDSVGRALDRMIENQQHLLLVRDDLDQAAGLITLEDCIETLLGVEIVDETDDVEDMRKFARDLAARRRGLM